MSPSQATLISTIVFATWLIAMIGVTVWSGRCLGKRWDLWDLRHKWFANPGVRWMVIVILAGVVLFIGSWKIYAAGGRTDGFKNPIKCTGWLSASAGQILLGIAMWFGFFGRYIAFIVVPMAIIFEAIVRVRSAT